MSHSGGLKRTHWKRNLATGASILAGVAAIFHTCWLTALGSFLVIDQPPEKADAILVLAGDFTGNRILTAAKLVRAGYAPKAVVSGPDGIFGMSECDLSIPFAVKAGFPESYFIHFEN